MTRSVNSVGRSRRCAWAVSGSCGEGGGGGRYRRHLRRRAEVAELAGGPDAFAEGWLGGRKRRFVCCGGRRRWWLFR